MRLQGGFYQVFINDRSWVKLLSSVQCWWLSNGNHCTSHFELCPFPAESTASTVVSFDVSSLFTNVPIIKNNSWWIIECHVRWLGSNPLLLTFVWKQHSLPFAIAYTSTRHTWSTDSHQTKYQRPTSPTLYFKPPSGKWSYYSRISLTFILWNEIIDFTYYIIMPYFHYAVTILWPSSEFRTWNPT